MANEKRKTVALILSEKCNLNCVYCYEHTKNYQVMDIEIAKQALVDEFRKTKGYDGVEIHFHGGEPFMVFPLIKEISEWIWNQRFETPYILFATCNGTMLTPEIKDWLTQNKERFYVCLSLDGTKEMHDTNRCGSYDKIDKSFFYNNWPDQGVKMTISPQTVVNLAEGVIEVAEFGFVVNANLAMGMDWNHKELQEVYANQLKILADYYLNHPELPVCSILDMYLGMINKNDMEPLTKICGTGTSMVAYGPDGRKYPCHTFMPSVNFGESDNDAIWEAVKLSTYNDPMCENCLLRHQCSTCYGMNYYRCGNLGKRAEDYCKMNKIRAKAISYFYGKMLLTPEKYQKRLGKENLDRIANGVLLIQKELSI